MPVQYKPAEIDFSVLGRLPQLYRQGQEYQRENQARDALKAAINPDGSIDINKAAAALMQTNPVAAVGLLNKQHDTRVNPLTGEYYDSNAAPPAISQSYDAGQDDPATAGMSPIEKQAYVKAKAGAAGKLAAEQPQKDDAKKEVSNTLGDMFDNYLGLKAEGETSDPNQPALQNYKSYAKSTGLGQVIERARGTQGQQYRDSINTMRPMLINAIRQATKQGARGLDSNVELQFYLQQATDPSMGLAVNIKALQRLERAYGLGGIVDKKLAENPELAAEVNKTTIQLPKGMKGTPDEPAKWTPQSPPGVYDTPKGKLRYLGNNQWTDQ